MGAFFREKSGKTKKINKKLTHQRGTTEVFKNETGYYSSFNFQANFKGIFKKMPYKQPPKDKQFGQPGGNKPGPKPKGALSKKTIFELALKEVATALKLGEEPDKIKIELVKRGIREGLAANFPFWQAIMKMLNLSEEEKLKIEGEMKIEQTTEMSPELKEAIKFYEREIIKREYNKRKSAGLGKGREN